MTKPGIYTHKGEYIARTFKGFNSKFREAARYIDKSTAFDNASSKLPEGTYIQITQTGKKIKYKVVAKVIVTKGYVRHKATKKHDGVRRAKAVFHYVEVSN